MTSVLVADDSALMRRIDCDIINSVENFCAEDIAFDENSTLKKLSERDFDIVLFNVSFDSSGSGHFMEKLSDLKKSTAVVAISYPISEDRNLVGKAYKEAAGFFIRPFHMSAEEREEYKAHLSSALRNALEKKQSLDSSMKKKKLDTMFSSAYKPSIKAALQIAKKRKAVSNGPYRLVALACSTGGPQALHKMIPMITKTLPVPFIIVQHMPFGFTAPLAKRLSESSGLTVKEVRDGEILLKNVIYIAPGGRHLEIEDDDSGNLKAKVYDGEPVNSLKPCADVTYDSLRHCSINNILCVVLTGMGMDGTMGIAELSSVKNTFVLSQDEKSSVVYGMPKSVFDCGLSNEVQPLENIAQSIMKKLGG